VTALTLNYDGAVRCDRAALSILGSLDALADCQPQERAGIRLRSVEALAPLLAIDGPLGALAARTLASGCRPVRAILFDKTEATNWALGSHRFGRIAESEIDAVVERCGTIACLAARGDVWLYATLILHASEAAIRPARRRVLQIDFAADDLPGDLEWLSLRGGEATP
jgi:hypothetical protein